MTEITRYKFWGVLAAILISLYTLAPTALGLRARVQNLVASGQDIPWYFSILPQAELNLGLDLRGGLYVELGVDLEKAEERERDALISEMVRTTIAEDDKDTVIKAIDKDTLRVESTGEKIDATLASLRKGYQMYLKDVNGTREVFFKLKGSLDEAKKSVQTAIDASKRSINYLAAYKNQYLALTYTSVDDKQWIMTTFSGEAYKAQLELVESLPGVAYVKIGEEYFKSVQADILQQAAGAVRNRIDRFGVAEASVSIQGGERIIVEVPGVQQQKPIESHDESAATKDQPKKAVVDEVERVMDIVKQTGELSFHLLDDTKSFEEARQLVIEKVTVLKLDEEAGLVDTDLEKLTGDQIPKLFTQENIDKINKALKSELPEGSSIYVRFVRDEITDVITDFTPMLLFDRADITGEMLEQARPDRDNGQWIVTMSFNPVGAKIFGDVTTENIGKLFAIVLDGRVMLAPRIKSAIVGGSAQIELGYGEESAAEAKKIALILKEGALPARLTVESQSIIGPSLGQDAIDAGLKSVLIAALVVILFMMAYYKVGGIIANLALMLNVVMIFAIMSLFGASLSLPGIAGIVLTMGMAVDANVIIFERMREEKYRARSAKDVIHSGYSNAMSAILDGNITTFFAGIVLFQFGTGPIKGFATTLMIGIVTTVFTAVIVTQVIYEVMLEKFGMQKVSC